MEERNKDRFEERMDYFKKYGYSQKRIDQLRKENHKENWEKCKNKNNGTKYKKIRTNGKQTKNINKDKSIKKENKF